MALDRFLQAPEEPKRVRIYLASEAAFERKCRECRFLVKAEKVETPMFKWRVLCASEECAKSSE